MYSLVGNGTRSCDFCYQLKPNNQKEPLMQDSEGQLPFEKVGVDLCE